MQALGSFGTMADPFEVRRRFTSIPSYLSASTSLRIEVAHYALLHRDKNEDLHSCILDGLETPPAKGQSQANIKNCANIMYFLEHHVDVN